MEKIRYTIEFEMGEEHFENEVDAFGIGELLNKDLTLLIPGEPYARVIPASCIRSITEERR